MFQKRNLLNTVLLAIIIVEFVLVLYKYFDWNRIDILNAATLITSSLAIIALVVNIRQYQINAEKRLEEQGNYRIEHYYKDKLNRINSLEVPIHIVSSEYGDRINLSLDEKNLHYRQHHLISFLIGKFENSLGSNVIYGVDGYDNDSREGKDLCKILNDFYLGIYNRSPLIYNYHKQHIDIIKEIRLDEKLSDDQKKFFITKLLMNEMFGYSMLFNGGTTNNFKIIKKIDRKGEIDSIGYLDYLISLLPPKSVLDEALGGYKNLFKENMPNSK